MTERLATYPASGYFDQTVEAITIQVSAGGTDPTVLRRFYTQAEIDAHGAFLTLQAAVDALPSIYAHDMTIELADGDHTFPNFPSFARFFPAGVVGTTTPKIKIVSASKTERPAGAPSTYAVTSGTSTSFTLASDPGFSANQFRSHMASVVSGTGAGQTRFVRSHSGAGPWETAGRWNPVLDATSVVEILQPAARLTLSDGLPGIIGANVLSPLGRNFRIEGLDILSSGGTSWYVLNLHAEMHLSRVLGLTTNIYNCSLWPDVACFDRQNTAGDVIALRSGAFRCATTIGSVLVRGNTGSSSHGIEAVGNSQAMNFGAFVFALTLAIDDIGGDAIHAQGKPARVQFSSTGGIHTLGSGITGHFCLADFGAELDFNSGFDTNLPSGTAGDISHDGVTTTYATLAADPDQAIVGQRGSLIRV